MRRYTSGDVYRAFLKEDKDTVLRKLNLRYFARDYKVEYYISQSIWLIDFEDFMKKINPNGIDKEYQMPRLRTKISAQNDWNAHHRPKIKHFIIDQICDSGKVTVYKHGRFNIINYDELEEELKRRIREKIELRKLAKEQKQLEEELKEQKRLEKEKAKLEKEQIKRKRGRPRKTI